MYREVFYVINNQNAVYLYGISGYIHAGTTTYRRSISDGCFKRGTTFQKFVHQLNDLGYEVQYRELIAADYGAPTTRKRFFLIARCDGKPIVWPSPTHAPADIAQKSKMGI